MIEMTTHQAAEVAFIFAMVLLAFTFGAYAIGVAVARSQDDIPDSPPLPEVPDLTIRLKHVAPSTAALFRQLEQEAGYDTTPLGTLIQPAARPGRHRYGQARTTAAIEAMKADTDKFLAQMGPQ